MVFCACLWECIFNRISLYGHHRFYIALRPPAYCYIVNLFNVLSHILMLGRVGLSGTLSYRITLLDDDDASPLGCAERAADAEATDPTSTGAYSRHPAETPSGDAIVS